MKNLVILGCGGFGRGIYSVVSAINDQMPTWNVLGFYDDSPSEGDVTTVRNMGLDVLGTTEDLTKQTVSSFFVIGIADTTARKRIAAHLQALGHLPATLIHPASTLAPLVSIGEGTVVCAGARIANNATLGNHVHVNMNCMVGHDAKIEDFVTVHPLAAVCGFAHLEALTIVGASSCILPSIAIAQGNRIAAGAVVTHDTSPNEVLVGVPARPSPAIGRENNRRAY